MTVLGGGVSGHFQTRREGVSSPWRVHLTARAIVSRNAQLTQLPHHFLTVVNQTWTPRSEFLCLHELLQLLHVLPRLGVDPLLKRTDPDEGVNQRRIVLGHNCRLEEVLFHLEDFPENIRRGSGGTFDRDGNARDVASTIACKKSLDHPFHNGSLMHVVFSIYTNLLNPKLDMRRAALMIDRLVPAWGGVSTLLAPPSRLLSKPRTLLKLACGLDSGQDVLRLNVELTTLNELAETVR